MQNGGGTGKRQSNIRISSGRRAMNDAIQQQRKDTGRAIEVVIRLDLVAGLVMWWCFGIIRPFVSTIIWAMIIAAALSPAYSAFSNRVGLSRRVTATLFTTAI
jgi:predicted PurR-regulated permease PerM